MQGDVAATPKHTLRTDEWTERMDSDLDGG